MANTKQPNSTQWEDLVAKIKAKQTELVSGTNIKTVNNTSLLGSGDIAVQPTLVSGTNIKTINSTTLLGTGNFSLVPTTRTVNSKALSANITLDAADVNAVPTTRTVNGKALSSDITLAASDVGALSTTGGTITGNLLLKGSGNYGNAINFGDGDYVHISEPTDDALEIKASKINFVVSGGASAFTLNGNTIGGGSGSGATRTLVYSGSTGTSSTRLASVDTGMTSFTQYDYLEFQIEPAYSPYLGIMAEFTHIVPTNTGRTNFKFGFPTYTWSTPSQNMYNYSAEFYTSNGSIMMSFDCDLVVLTATGLTTVTAANGANFSLKIYGIKCY